MATPRVMAITKLAATRSSVMARLIRQLAGGAVLDDLGQHQGRRRHQARIAGEHGRHLPRGQQRQERQGRDQHAAQLPPPTLAGGVRGAPGDGETAGHGPQKLTCGQKVPGASSLLLPTSFSPPSSARIAIQLRRLGLLLRPPMLDDALAVAAHEGVLLGLALGPCHRHQPLPLGVAGQHDLLGGARGAGEGQHQLGVVVGPALLEDVAQLRHRGRHAQAPPAPRRCRSAADSPAASSRAPKCQ